MSDASKREAREGDRRSADAHGLHDEQQRHDGHEAREEAQREEHQREVQTPERRAHEGIREVPVPRAPHHAGIEREVEGLVVPGAKAGERERCEERGRRERKVRDPGPGETVVVRPRVVHGVPAIGIAESASA